MSVSRCAATVCVALSIAIAGLANATPINVVNPGFDYTTASGVNTPGWSSDSALVGDNSTPTPFTAWPTGSDTTVTVAGWSSTNGNAGVEQLGASNWYAGNYPGDGNAVGSANGAGGGTLNGCLYQMLPGQLKPSTTYTLTATLYLRADGLFPGAGDIVVGLTAPAAQLTGGVTSIIMPTSSGPGTATYTVTTGSTVASNDLKIVLGNSTPSGYTQVAFDNVMLSGTAIPEPSAIALATACLFGLLAYAWRRRK